MKLATWATQAALSRPGRGRLDKRQVDAINHDTLDPKELKWPRGRVSE
jgi:hypothetical protein